MADDLVRLISTCNSDECNHAGVAYKVTSWNTVLVHPDAVPSLIKTGGFYVAGTAESLIRHSTLSECYEACWALPPSKERSTLLAILQSPNSLAHLCQSISFS
jgi:hypothetical protein